MNYEPQNGEEELLMLAGRIAAFEDLLDACEGDVISIRLCQGVFGFRRKDGKNNSTNGNNELD